jgi:hypothetical protein
MLLGTIPRLIGPYAIDSYQTQGKWLQLNIKRNVCIKVQRTYNTTQHLKTKQKKQPGNYESTSENRDALGRKRDSTVRPFI